jgi:uncharacterized protein (TIGR00725 family)
MGVIVSVIGGSSANEELLDAARRLGFLLGEAGYTVLCGGGTGVMENVCRGVKSAGGTTIGILPGEHASHANPWIDISIPTGMGSARNRIIALSGRAVVAVGGRYGTLSEIAFALDADKPVCSLAGWTEIPGVVEVASPEEALDFVHRTVEGEGYAGS